MDSSYNWQKAFERANLGDRKLLDKLIGQAYQEILFPFISPKTDSDEDTNEICSFVISKFWERFFSKKEPLPENVNGYIYRMGMNALIQFSQSKKKRTRTITPLDDQRLKMVIGNTLSENVENDLFKRDDKEDRVYRILHYALNELGEKCKKLLLLSIVEKKRMKKIISILDFPTVNAATQKKTSCLKKMRKIMYLKMRI